LIWKRKIQKWWAMQVSNLRPLQCENANISLFSRLKTTP